MHPLQANQFCPALRQPRRQPGTAEREFGKGHHSGCLYQETTWSPFAANSGDLLRDTQVTDRAASTDVTGLGAWQRCHQYNSMAQPAGLQAGRHFQPWVCPAAGTETTTFATKGNQMFRVAGVTSHSQKTLLKAAAFEVLHELLADATWQHPTPAAHCASKAG